MRQIESLLVDKAFVGRSRGRHPPFKPFALHNLHTNKPISLFRPHGKPDFGPPLFRLHTACWANHHGEICIGWISAVFGCQLVLRRKRLEVQRSAGLHRRNQGTLLGMLCRFAHEERLLVHQAGRIDLRLFVQPQRLWHQRTVVQVAVEGLSHHVQRQQDVPPDCRLGPYLCSVAKICFLNCLRDRGLRN